jgi:flavodoxin
MLQNGNILEDQSRGKALLIVYSYHHMNTEKVANVFAKVLGAQVKTPQQTRPGELGDNDLIGFGSGIDSGRHYKELLDFADQLPPAAGKKAFIFSTNGAPASLFSESMSRDQMAKNHSLIKDKLEAKGYTIVGEFSCPGFNTNLFLKHLGGLNKGRPNEEDLKRAEEFARGLKA